MSASSCSHTILSIKNTSISSQLTSSSTGTTLPARTTPAATVIVPLYIYTSPGAWSTLFASLAANPNLKFLVVIDPANGPGAPNTYPDSNYISSISTLRTYQNAIPISYVHTSYATRTINDVLTDIETCSHWKNYAQADIHMSGIFFDEAVYAYNTTTLAYMTNITAFTRGLLGMGNDTIVFNPGEVVPSQWYSLADHIVAFENDFTAYSSAIIGYISPPQRPQSLFIVYGFSGSQTTQQTLVDGVVTAGIGGLFVTTQQVYTAWSTLWAQFCSSMTPVEV